MSGAAEARRWPIHETKTQVRVSGKEGWFGCGRAVLKKTAGNAFSDLINALMADLFLEKSN
jgi:hypothetical protein